MPAESPAMPMNYKKGSWLKILIVAVIAIIIILAGVYAIMRLTRANSDLSKSSATAIEAMDWKAVFLSNGEIYFGIIQRQHDNQLVLNNVWYITRQTATDPTKDVQPKLSLVKLGNEVYAPENSMTINMQNVLYVEKLQKTSNVIQLIKMYNTDNTNAINNQTLPNDQIPVNPSTSTLP